MNIFDLVDCDFCSRSEKPSGLKTSRYFFCDSLGAMAVCDRCRIEDPALTHDMEYHKPGTCLECGYDAPFPENREDFEIRRIEC